MLLIFSSFASDPDEEFNVCMNPIGEYVYIVPHGSPECFSPGIEEQRMNRSKRIFPEKIDKIT